MHALGVMGVKSGAIVQHVEENADQIVSEAKTQEIANIAYAFAKLGVKAGKWFKALEREDMVAYLIEEGKPQHISNVIWARATLGIRGDELARAINKEMVVEKVRSRGSRRCHLGRNSKRPLLCSSANFINVSNGVKKSSIPLTTLVAADRRWSRPDSGKHDVGHDSPRRGRRRAR